MDLKQKDLKQHGLSKMNHMRKQSSGNTGQKPLFMKTLRKLILEQFQRLTSSQEDSPVRTSAMLENDLGSRGVVLHSGNITVKPLGFYDPDTQSLKTYQRLLIEDSMLCLQTLPRSGMMRNGIVSQLPPLVRLTKGTGHLSLPTLTVNDSKNNGGKSQTKRHGLGLNTIVKMPTLTKEGCGNKKHYKETPQASSKLNPEFAEWLMGFPIGWTELDALETQSFRKLRKSLQKQSRR